MDSQDEIRQLLVEIRDAQQKHHEEWKQALQESKRSQEVEVQRINTRLRRSKWGLIIFVLAILIIPQLLSYIAFRSSTRDLDVKQLLALYRQGGGSDDLAGEALKSTGDRAKTELIRISDAPDSSPLMATTAHEVLQIYFPSPDADAAIDRYIARMTNAAEQATYRKIIQEMRERR